MQTTYIRMSHVYTKTEITSTLACMESVQKMSDGLCVKVI